MSKEWNGGDQDQSVLGAIARDKLDKVDDALGTLAEHVEFTAPAAETDKASQRPGRDLSGRLAPD